MINQALKLLRVYHNLKQKELAGRLGISSSHLSEIESGQKGVNYDMLQRYSEVLRIPVSTIALFAEASEHPATASRLGKTPEKAIRLLEWLDTITEVEANDSDDQTASR